MRLRVPLWATDEAVALRADLADRYPNRSRPGNGQSWVKVVHQIALTSPGGIAIGRQRPTPLIDRVALGPSVFRAFRCVSGCTACCLKFTLDYIPEEEEQLDVDRAVQFHQRSVHVGGAWFDLYTSDQTDHVLCDFLTAVRPEGGLGCALYPRAPLSCASAPQLQFLTHGPNQTNILKRPFSRAWAMAETPQCEFTAEFDEETRASVIGDVALLDRFISWARYFRIPTVLPHVREFLSDRLAAGDVSIPPSGILFDTKEAVL